IREMLQTVQTAYMRDILIKALVVNDGASAREMAEAAEVFIAHPSEEPTLGKYVVEHVRDRDDVAQLLLARADALQTTNAERAAALRSTVMQWPVPSSDALLVRRIEEETADVPTILAALLRRESLRASHPDALRRLNSLRGTRAGIAAILLGDARNEQRILLSDDIDAQCALLSAARLVPEPLPIAMVAALFGRTQELDEAAEAWLIGNDSAEARAIVQRRHPNELLILGYGGFEEWEQDVLRAFKSSKDDEVIALGMAGVMPATTALTIHIRNGKATLVSERRRIALGLNVARELQSFDDLGPLENGTTDAIIYEYLHLTRRSARRIVMNAPASTAESPHAELVRTLLALIE
ncbi:MAG TPA: hypothetical protein VJZ00_24020, partial [Thermoanaerobaculia bacterium]|nr:hypothetical protein [Thermoanaerobaculia bacterium]